MPFVSTQTSWGSYFVVEMLVVTPEIQTPSCTKGGTRYRQSFTIVVSLIDVSKAGAWLPFFRAHSGKATPKREPYLFPEDVQNVIRNAIQQRYKHLPVWYTLFHEYIVYKTPLIRPLFFHYTNDRNVFETQNQILVGRDIMVRAVTEPGVDAVSVYFPGGTDEYWISLSNFEVQGGGTYADVPVDINSIPIYYRAGSIIVRKDTVRPSTADMINDGHTLYVNLAPNSTAHGTVYLDDTTSLFYLDYVEYNYLSIDYAGGEVTFTKIDSHANSGQFDFVVDLVVTHELSEMPIDGKKCKMFVFDRLLFLFAGKPAL
jgi:alpha 1,3-glucosidase